jgi:hypothetical protein
MSPSRRGPEASIGLKILLAAVVVVAGVIGFSGIYPRVIDAEWVTDTTSRLYVMSLSNPDAGTRALGAVTTGLSSRSVATTGRAVAPPPTPTLDTSQRRRATANAVAPAPEAVAPLAVTDVPEAQTKPDALQTEAAPALVAKVTEKPKLVVKKRVVQVAHRSSFRGYAQPSGGWGGQGGSYRL